MILINECHMNGFLFSMSVQTLIIMRVLHTGACANAASLTYLLGQLKALLTLKYCLAFDSSLYGSLHSAIFLLQICRNLKNASVN